MFTRRWLGAGTAAALAMPIVLNLLVRARTDEADMVQELASAGPFESLADGQAGRPVSTAAKASSFAWTFRYCLRTSLPATEVLELRNVVDGTVILRSSNAIQSGSGLCPQGAGSIRIPVDARGGYYELARRITVLPAAGAPITVPLTPIPIEVIP